MIILAEVKISVKEYEYDFWGPSLTPAFTNGFHDRRLMSDNSGRQDTVKLLMPGTTLPGVTPGVSISLSQHVSKIIRQWAVLHGFRCFLSIVFETYELNLE